MGEVQRYPTLRASSLRAAAAEHHAHVKFRARRLRRSRRAGETRQPELELRSVVASRPNDSSCGVLAFPTNVVTL